MTCSIISGVARRRKVGGGGTIFFFVIFQKKVKSKKKKKQQHTHTHTHRSAKAQRGGGILDDGPYCRTTPLCSISIKVVLKGGSGGPPPENFYSYKYKIWQSWAFLDTYHIPVLPQRVDFM